MQQKRGHPLTGQEATGLFSEQSFLAGKWQPDEE